MKIYCKYLRKAKDYLSAATVLMCHVGFFNVKMKSDNPFQRSLNLLER